MTPISTLTNDELDRLIAERRGWETCSCESCRSNGNKYWIDPKNGEVIGDNPPSFTTDPRYAFELLEEMVEAGHIIRLNKTDTGKYVIGRLDDTGMVFSEKLKRAIAERWLDWKGGV